MSSPVVDTGYLRRASLGAFLAASRDNRAVLASEIGVETSRGDPLRNIAKSIAIVAQYPSQVVILRHPADIIEVQNAGAAGLGRDALIDPKQTAIFGAWCRQVQEAIRGDRVLAEGIARYATDYRSRAEEKRAPHWPEMIGAISTLATKLPEDFRKRLRRRQPLSPDDLAVVAELIRYFAADMLRNHPFVRVTPSDEDLWSHWIFRSATSAVVFYLEWWRKGGIENLATEKFANDLSDNEHLVAATYFDGLLSNDGRLVARHAEVRQLLDLLRPRPGKLETIP